MMKLDEKHIDYIEQQFEIMRQQHKGQLDLALECHQSVAAIAQAIAVVISPEDAVFMLESIAQNVKDGTPLLKAMHEGFKLRVMVMRDIWHMPGENL